MLQLQKKRKLTLALSKFTFQSHFNQLLFPVPQLFNGIGPTGGKPRHSRC